MEEYKKVNKAVISGCTGSMAVALINKLISENIYVLALCNPHSKRTGNIPRHPLIEIKELSLNDYKDFLPNTSDFDIFFHFAWVATDKLLRNELQSQLPNIQYTLDAMQLAKQLGCHTFIGAGSQAEYGRKNKPVSEDFVCMPENAYGLAKFTSGLACRLQSEKDKLRFIWTRIFSTFGFYDKQTLLTYLINELKNHHIPQLTAGEQIWDFLYADDAAEAFYKLAQFGKSGETYNIASGIGRPLKEYILEVRDIISPNSSLKFGDIPYSPKEVMFLQGDISKLTRDTGFVPKVTFQEGIERILTNLENTQHCW